MKRMEMLLRRSYVEEQDDCGLQPRRSIESRRIIKCHLQHGVCTAKWRVSQARVACGSRVVGSRCDGGAWEELELYRTLVLLANVQMKTK
jgi:hypothetical protein